MEMDEPMGYTLLEWKKRYAERSDMSTHVTHLTRNGAVNGEPANAIQVLFAILKKKRLIGSTTESGFIAGSTPAVCFQDAPPSSLCQNVYYEQKYRETNQTAKIRYLGIGLMFEKQFAFNKGARPVIYDRKNTAKEYLPPEEWWRIVHMDLANPASVIDWSHEREWRCPNDFTFEHEDVRVVLTNKKAYHTFLEMCSADADKIHHKIAGIAVLDMLLR